MLGGVEVVPNDEGHGMNFSGLFMMKTGMRTRFPSLHQPSTSPSDIQTMARFSSKRMFIRQVAAIYHLEVLHLALDKQFPTTLWPERAATAPGNK
jgi:hypothetical protein